ncbi:MAG: ABC transporter ATP-binding protein [Spirochaetales bacterium]|nr:ABC transporter ATP-binding protein [Spirochaetales bacterium]
MLRVDAVNVFYGETQVLWEVSLECREGEILAVVGPNGAGKTTLMRVLTGLLHPRGGRIGFRGSRIDQLPPHEIVRLGIAMVPEGRRLFPKLTVLENLQVGNYLRQNRAHRGSFLEEVFSLFPRLYERRSQLAQTLSGGESQMLAVGRALMSNPQLLAMDEPSLGLAPNLVDALFDTVRKLNAQGRTILIVEQHVSQALEIADRAYLLENGSVALEGSGAGMLGDEHVKKAYLGL